MSDKPLLGRKVAVLVETEYIYDEIEFYKRRIPELGGELTVLSYLWGKPSKDLMNDIDSPDRPITAAHRLTVTECVTQHDPTEFDVVICAANYVAVRLREILPMGSLGSPALTRTAPAVQFFARAMENRRIVKGALCHALWLLTPRPDLLKNRRVICHTVVLADIHNAGAVYIPAPNHVVVDNDLVTARSFADHEAYFDAIVATVLKGTQDTCAAPLPTKDILDDTAASLLGALKARFAGIAPGDGGNNRPVAKAAMALLDGTLNVAAEVKRMTGVDLDTTCAAKRKPILLLASKFGVWASELTLVAATLLKAGYEVKIATEDGSPPHLLAPSLNPDFADGAWRGSVVSQEEQALAMRFLCPTSNYRALFKPENILDLRQLPKPPQAGDYLKDPSLLGKYGTAIRSALDLADQYDAIVIAGGAIPGFMDDRGLQCLILAFHRLGKPVMGECNGGLCIAQTIDPRTGKSILNGRAVTTHSWLDEYQAGWGWTQAFSAGTDSFWKDGKFDLEAYSKAEQWVSPGMGGNPLIDSELFFRDAAGPDGLFFSPPGSAYSVVIDEHLITCRTTPDGYPGVLALLAVLAGRPALRGRLFIDADERGRRQPVPPAVRQFCRNGVLPWDAARRGDLESLTRWLVGGRDPNVADPDGWTPLLLAAAHGQATVVDLLLGHDIPGIGRADPDLRFPGADALPIYFAGQRGDLATVKTLLRVRPGHIFDVATVNGHTVLLQAAFYGQKRHQELASYLLENIGAILLIPEEDQAAIASVRKRLMTATNVRGQNALALAQAYNIRPMVEVLRKFDSSLESDRSAYYRRLLGRIVPPAPCSDDERQMQDVTERLTEAIQSAFDYAARSPAIVPDLSAGDQQALASIEGLLNSEKLEINRLGGPLQRTPLITACTGADGNERQRCLRARIVDMLLQRGADPLIHEVHAMGVNAVIRAVVWGHLCLLERFAAVLAPPVLADALNEKPAVNGFTALHDSVLRALSAQDHLLAEYLRQIERLVECGARYDIEDHTGWTQEAIAGDALRDPDFQENARQVLNVLHRNRPVP